MRSHGPKAKQDQDTFFAVSSCYALDLMQNMYTTPGREDRYVAGCLQYSSCNSDQTLSPTYFELDGSSPQKTAPV